MMMGRTCPPPHNGRTRRPFLGDRLSPRRRSIAKKGLEAFLASWLNFPDSGIFSHRAENDSPSWLNFPDLGKFSPEGKRQRYPTKAPGRTILALLGRSIVFSRSSVNPVLPVLTLAVLEQGVWRMVTKTALLWEGWSGRGQK